MIGDDQASLAVTQPSHGSHDEATGGGEKVSSNRKGSGTRQLLTTGPVKRKKNGAGPRQSLARRRLAILVQERAVGLGMEPRWMHVEQHHWYVPSMWT